MKFVQNCLSFLFYEKLLQSEKMNSFHKALESVKLGAHNETKNKFEEAIDDYTRAVRHFRSVLFSDEEEVINFKSKIENEIEFYLKRTKKLEFILQKQGKENSVESKEHKIQIYNEKFVDQDFDDENKNEIEIKFYLKHMNNMDSEIALLKKK